VGAGGRPRLGGGRRGARRRRARGPAGPRVAYQGCYTTPDRNGHGEGINVYRVDPDSGGWTHVQLLQGIANPSFLALDPRQRVLYCVHGGNDFSAVSAFAIDQRTGRVTPLNTQPSGGPNPVHLAVDASARFLVVANYDSGTLGVLPLGRDGALGPPSAVVEQTGELGPDRAEQAGPHPHDVPLDPAGRFVVVPDKGLDQVFVYRLDPGRGTLVPNDPPAVRTRRRAGPRHVAFHPSLPYAYVINELDSSVTTYRYDAAAGALAPLQVSPSLPTDYTGDNTGAEIAVAPSGRFVYGSNRGHDSIAIFAVDPGAGTLAPVGWEPTRGKTPRHFALDPSGAFLYAANQDSDTVVSFRVDPETGTLAATGQVVPAGSPVSIVFTSP
jgi:6-phosphogluconolactonase (cycloisomerase 2 family)